VSSGATQPTLPSLYVELDRASWARLRHQAPLTLTEDDLTRLRGVNETVDLREIEEVYLPLCRMLGLRIESARALHAATSEFLGESSQHTPFIIGVAGSVAVGKSTTSRLLRELLARGPLTPKVSLVTTDGFLLPNAELQRRGLLERKGFPESYDRRALLRFVSEVKSGRAEVKAPVYSHLTYDIVPGEFEVVKRPDVLIVEGLNVLQVPRIEGDRHALAVSDFFDFSVYVDAKVEDIRRWYLGRFLRLRQTAFVDPSSYFHRFSELSEADALALANRFWTDINEVNLVKNVLPTRTRASLILVKGADHGVSRLKLRKL
jgi:type I pantothenate kinase